MEGFSSNLNDTFTSTRGCAETMFFPQHILPLLPLYNAQWWGYESLTAIALVKVRTSSALVRTGSFFKTTCPWTSTHVKFRHPCFPYKNL